MNDWTPFKEELLAEKAKLENELSSIGRRNPANPADWEALPSETGAEADPIDAASLIEGYETNTAILKELETRYNDVLAALGKIENGTYGTCEDSGGQISIERLRANPAARTCSVHTKNDNS